jgi:N-acetylneuraminic acid mutarotase
MKLTLLFVFISSFSLFGQIPSGIWSAVEVETSGTKRHESAFVNCDGVFYALGGRGKRPVDAYYPKQNLWEFVADAPFEFHHFQAVSFHHEIYVMGAMTGNYPHEKPLANMWIFNPRTKVWREGAAIPTERLRGSAGVFVRKDKIYLVSGIQDGHWDGHVKWFDVFDPKTNQWEKLSDAPRARDHFQATLVGDQLYVAGGRTSHASIGKVLNETIGEVDVYDFKKGSWTTLANPLPTQRAGTASIGQFPYLIVMLGESISQTSAHAEVEALDVRTGEWVKFPSLIQGRHGTGVVNYKGKLYVANGSANRGGGPELNSIEYLQLN